jgi:hypothetical protein
MMDIEYLSKKYIQDVGQILERLEEMDLILSIDMSKFGINEIVVVGHFCGRYERKRNPENVNVIARMKICGNTTKVKRFLGAYIFYQI